MSLLATVGEVFWKSQGSYGQSKLLAQSVGRKQLVWDFRSTNAASQLGKPPSTLAGMTGSTWVWDGPYDVHILLPNGRELKTDVLLISVTIENGKVQSINMNGGTQLTPKEMRVKIAQEVETMRPNLRYDGLNGVEAVEEWYAKPPPRGDTVMWIVRDGPDVTARVRDLSGSNYIVQYELWWANP